MATSQPTDCEAPTTSSRASDVDTALRLAAVEGGGRAADELVDLHLAAVVAVEGVAAIDVGGAERDVHAGDELVDVHFAVAVAVTGGGGPRVGDDAALRLEYAVGHVGGAVDDARATGGVGRQREALQPAAVTRVVDVVRPRIEARTARAFGVLRAFLLQVVAAALHGRLRAGEHQVVGDAGVGPAAADFVAPQLVAVDAAEGAQVVGGIPRPRDSVFK